jgi:hypothetical protein
MRPKNHLKYFIQMHIDEVLDINSSFLLLNQRV